MTAEASDSFKYQPLHGSHEIRLISLVPAGRSSDPIHCDVVHASLLGACPDYEAISYTWLSDEDLACGLYHEHISLPGCPRFAVTPSCQSALRRFRNASSARLLWIDAICIDQSNVVERSQQVLLMGCIYHSALHVLIWLGEETPSDAEAVASTHTMHDFFQQCALDQKPLGKVLWKQCPNSGLHLPYPEDKAWVSVCDFLWRRWFYRAWIVQEVAMAKDATLHCGRLTMKWNVLADVTRQLNKQGLTFYLRSTRNGAKAVPLAVRYIDWIKTEVIRGNKKMKLVETLTFSQCFQVTDERDRIYSLLEFVEDEQQIKPDYTIDVANLYSKVVADAITSFNSLQVLERVQGVSATGNFGIPSWVGSWNLNRVPLSELTPGLNAGSSKKLCYRIAVDRKTLVVQGRLIDEIQDVVPHFTNLNVDGRYSLKWASWKRSRDTLEWVKTIELVAKRAWKTKYLSADMLERVARLLALDSMNQEQKDRNVSYHKFYHDWKDLHRMLLFHLEGAGEVLDLPKEIVEYQERLQEYAAAIVEAVNFREFCSTIDGKLGLMPMYCQTGDKICILYGCKTPFVIRPCNDGSFQFIGECYVDGLMKGEALESPQMTKKKFWKWSNTKHIDTESIEIELK